VKCENGSVRVELCAAKVVGDGDPSHGPVSDATISYLILCLTSAILIFTV